MKIYTKICYNLILTHFWPKVVSWKFETTSSGYRNHVGFEVQIYAGYCFIEKIEKFKFHFRIRRSSTNNISFQCVLYTKIVGIYEDNSTAECGLALTVDTVNCLMFKQCAPARVYFFFFFVITPIIFRTVWLVNPD